MVKQKDTEQPDQRNNEFSQIDQNRSSLMTLFHFYGNWCVIDEIRQDACFKGGFFTDSEGKGQKPTELLAECVLTGVLWMVKWVEFLSKSGERAKTADLPVWNSSATVMLKRGLGGVYQGSTHTEGKKNPQCTGGDAKGVPFHIWE